MCAKFEKNNLSSMFNLILVLIFNLCVFTNSLQEFEQFIDRLDFLVAEGDLIIECNPNEIQHVRSVTTYDDLKRFTQCSNKKNIFRLFNERVQIVKIPIFTAECMSNDQIEVKYHFVRQQKSLDKKENGVAWPFIYIKTFSQKVNDNPIPIKLKFYDKKDIWIKFFDVNRQDLPDYETKFKIYLFFTNRPIACIINIEGFKRTNADKHDECENKRDMGSAFFPYCYYRVGAEKAPAYKEILKFYDEVYPLIPKNSSNNYTYIPNLKQFKDHIYQHSLKNKHSSTFQHLQQTSTSIRNSIEQSKHFISHPSTTHTSNQQTSTIFSLSNSLSNQQFIKQNIHSTTDNVQQIHTQQLHDDQTSTIISHSSSSSDKELSKENIHETPDSIEQIDNQQLHDHQTLTLTSHSTSLLNKQFLEENINETPDFIQQIDRQQLNDLQTSTFISHASSSSNKELLKENIDETSESVEETDNEQLHDHQTLTLTSHSTILSNKQLSQENIDLIAESGEEIVTELLHDDEISTVILHSTSLINKHVPKESIDSATDFAKKSTSQESHDDHQTSTVIFHSSSSSDRELSKENIDLTEDSIEKSTEQTKNTHKQIVADSIKKPIDDKDISTIRTKLLAKVTQKITLDKQIKQFSNVPTIDFVKKQTKRIFQSKKKNPRKSNSSRNQSNLILNIRSTDEEEKPSLLSIGAFLSCLVAIITLLVLVLFILFQNKQSDRSSVSSNQSFQS